MRHRDEIVVPIVQHWGIFETSGLDRRAEEARAALASHLDELEGQAQRFEERRAASA